MSLHSIIKDSKLKKSLYGARSYYYSFLLAAMRIHRVDRNKILFNNFQGKGFSCNPRAVAEKMHELAPDKELVWVISDEKQAETLPDYLRTVKLDTVSYFREIATSAVWVFNITPARGMIKRKNQFFMQTYHGDRAIKKVHYQNVGKAETDKKYAVHDEICDVGTVGSKMGERLFREGLGYHGKLLKYGIPRNDCLINLDPLKSKAIKTKLNIPEDVKILLYAPTFRTGRKQLNCPIDFSGVLDCLQEKTGDKWICFYRAHYHTHQINLAGNTEDRILNVSDYPDMADLLMVSDFLITDYSSSSGDFALRKKPIVLFLDEDERYNRTLLFDMNDTPYYLTHNQEELEKTIQDVDWSSFAENCQQILDFYGVYDTGKASEKACEAILDFINGLK